MEIDAPTPHPFFLFFNNSFKMDFPYCVLLKKGGMGKGGVGGVQSGFFFSPLGLMSCVGQTLFNGLLRLAQDEWGDETA